MLVAGTVVKSAAGHDKNKFYVIVQTDENSVFIADGKARPLEKPKRKNSKHVRKTNMVLDLNTVATNKKLREVLKSIDAAAAHEGGNKLCQRQT